MKFKFFIALMGLCILSNLNIVLGMHGQDQLPEFAYDFMDLRKPAKMGGMTWLRTLEGERNKADYRGNIEAFKGFTKEISATIAGKYGLSSRQATTEEQAELIRLIIATRRAFCSNSNLFEELYNVGAGNKEHVAAIQAIDTMADLAIKNEEFAQQWSEVKNDKPLKKIFTNAIAEHAKTCGRSLLNQGLPQSTIILVHELFCKELQNFPLGIGLSGSIDIYLMQDKDHRATAEQAQELMDKSDRMLTLGDCLNSLKTWNVSDFIKAVLSADELRYDELFSSSKVKQIIAEIDALPQSINPYINGYKLRLKRHALLMHNNFESHEGIRNTCIDLLKTMKASPIPFLKYSGITGLASIIARYSDWKEAVEFLESGQAELPAEYAPILTLDSCGWYAPTEKDGLWQYQLETLEKLTKSNDLKISELATYDLAQAYHWPVHGNPKKALELFEAFLEKGTVYINRYKILRSLADLLNGQSCVKDEERALKLYQEVIGNRKLADKYSFASSMCAMVWIYANSENPLIKNAQLAYEMASKFFYDESIPSYARTNVFVNLICSLRFGPEGVMDEQKALKVVNEVYYDKSSPSNARVEAFRFLVNILQFGPENTRDEQKAYELILNAEKDDTLSKWGEDCVFVEKIQFLSNGPHGIKDHKKAVELFESRPDFVHYNTSILDALVSIYQSYEHKDIPKAIKVCKRDPDICQKRPECQYTQQSQLVALDRILEIYKNYPKEPLDFEYAETIVKMIDENPKATDDIKIRAHNDLLEIQSAQKLIGK